MAPKPGPFCLRRKDRHHETGHSRGGQEAEGAKRFSVEDAGFQQGEQFDTDAIGG
jgi:hypothetical protein